MVFCFGTYSYVVAVKTTKRKSPYTKNRIPGTSIVVFLSVCMNLFMQSLVFCPSSGKESTGRFVAGGSPFSLEVERSFTATTADVMALPSSKTNNLS